MEEKLRLKIKELFVILLAEAMRICVEEKNVPIRRSTEIIIEEANKFARAGMKAFEEEMR